MPKGGHSRSGPQADPSSGRSDKRGFTLTALPSEGYSEDAPDLGDYLLGATERHLAIWNELWSSPQACAWSMEQWRWPQVADLVKYQVRDDQPDAPAALATSIRRLRDDLGLTKPGLVANGWAIAADQVSAKAAEKPAEPQKRERRLRSVDAQ